MSNVVDPQQRSSFAHLQSWLEEVRRQGTDNMSVLVVGNKADLAADRQVPREEAEAFARANGLKYIETSAKTAENVDAAFLSSAQDIYEKVKRGELFLESEEEKKAHTTVVSAQGGAGGGGGARQGAAGGAAGQEQKKSCCNVD